MRTAALTVTQTGKHARLERKDTSSGIAMRVAAGQTRKV
jgi:hypothetical protein